MKPPCPYNNSDVPNTADNLIAYLAHRGLKLYDQMTCEPFGPKAHVELMIHMHDLVLALRTLRDIDPNAADDVADRMITAAEAGDSYCLVLALRTLRDIDPNAADDVADRMITAAEAGDSYCEWLYAWAAEAGALPDDGFTS